MKIYLLTLTLYTIYSEYDRFENVVLVAEFKKKVKNIN
tara:strand:+ start:1313 stop:1426 length:114 start_codon:yes stop_codon:yes gene_type:complete